MDVKGKEVAKNRSISGEVEGAVDNKADTKSSTAQWVELATLAFGNFCAAACISLQTPFFPAEYDIMHIVD
ncbi:hypothetical protein JTE90_021920 [Oedothorax gibbosus]|uniref:Uncharacterized protein n=1 Tax=Oedothorax gibbosus TaxID=931172 RepID=A0AAV6VUC2_9ARAC|nr:hypothetical protein JTE90_021920 [Oedothorax gibbosus]